MHQLVEEDCYDWSDRILVTISTFLIWVMCLKHRLQPLSVCLDSNPQAAPNWGPQARLDSSVRWRTVGKQIAWDLIVLDHISRCIWIIRMSLLVIRLFIVMESEVHFLSEGHIFNNESVCFTVLLFSEIPRTFGNTF